MGQYHRDVEQIERTERLGSITRTSPSLYQWHCGGIGRYQHGSAFVICHGCPIKPAADKHVKLMILPSPAFAQKDCDAWPSRRGIFHHEAIKAHSFVMTMGSPFQPLQESENKQQASSYR